MTFVKLKSSFPKFYDRRHDFVDRYGISASEITTDMFTCSKHFPILFGAGNAYSSGAPEFTTGL